MPVSHQTLTAPSLALCAMTRYCCGSFGPLTTRFVPYHSPERSPVNFRQPPPPPPPNAIVVAAAETAPLIVLPLSSAQARAAPLSEHVPWRQLHLPSDVLLVRSAVRHRTDSSLCVSEKWKRDRPSAEVQTPASPAE